MLRKSLGVTHLLAECDDCDWHCELYRNGQALAAKHAKHHNHKVQIEVGLTGYYDGRKNPTPQPG